MGMMYIGAIFLDRVTLPQKVKSFLGPIRSPKKSTILVQWLVKPFGTDRYTDKQTEILLFFLRILSRNHFYEIFSINLYSQLHLPALNPKTLIITFALLYRRTISVQR